MSDGEITRLVRDLQQGHAPDDARLPEVVATLRQIARRQLASERDGHTLDTIALANEAYLKLSAGGAPWQSRAHFYGSAARAMRQILVDYARARGAQKRGGDVEVVPYEDDMALAFEAPPGDLLALDEALGRLGARNPRHVRVVECRFFLGLTSAEAAEALGTSVSTVERDWRMARAWLRRAMEETAPPEAADPSAP